MPRPIVPVAVALLVLAAVATAAQEAAVSIGERREKRAAGPRRAALSPNIVGGVPVSPKFKYPFSAAIVHYRPDPGYTLDLDQQVSDELPESCESDR